SQLRAWIGQDEQKRALSQRIERAADEWQRTGEGLWSRRLLRELQPFPDLPLGDKERRFLAASRRAALRNRLLLALVPLLLALAAFAIRARAQAASRELAAEKLRDASAALQAGREAAERESTLRTGSFAQFDAGETVAAEQQWAKVRALAAGIDRDLAPARAAVESALLLWPGEEARRLLDDLLVFRIERLRDDPLSRERAALVAQLDPALRARFERPARLRVDVPAKLQNGAALEPGKDAELQPGSYVLEIARDIKLPILLRAGDRQDLKLRDTPPPPDGFVAVPAGRFLYGFDGDEDVRRGFFGAPPMHERTSGAFAIGRTEVTFAQWIAYLRALPAAERGRRAPAAERIRLTDRRDGRYVLHLQPAARLYEAAEGSPIVYPGRTRNRAVDWLQFPVTGISFDDARAYASWAGARLCREEEWERAARGADGRAFPGGDTLAGDDANIDETYGREPLAFGPDPVGAHPRSTSPVEAVDMAGNAWEMTVTSSGTPSLRGGSWYQGALTARSVNREPYEPTARGILVGFRLCTNVR
ncbi:MAG: formylglycine-generating enzyme family protein, partial [Myxococcales bacterium]|nr:formylglycine-generating enzyme family protein [Myxococcales bacterium]